MVFREKKMVRQLRLILFIMPTLLMSFFLPKLEEMNVGDVWFQQNGATSRMMRTSMSQLRENFPGRLIYLRGDLQWSAHSPDLTPCDCIL